MSDDDNKNQGDGEEPTAADLIRDPETAQNMYEQRVKYFNNPDVRRALALERAEKQEPKGKPN
jgi:hypothetical protein